MVDKKLAVCVLLVLLLVFSVVTTYIYKQWKHLPVITTPSQKPSKPLKPVAVKKPFVKHRGEIQPFPPNQTNSGPQLPIIPCNTQDSVNNNSEVCSVYSKPTPSNDPANVPILPLYMEPKVVEEPNFECSPLTTFAPRVQREYAIYADSACRDFELYPTPQMYYFKFPLPFYNVISVDIIQAMLPRGEYQINVNNQTFYIQEPPNSPVPVTLTIGDYGTEALLAVEITAKLNAAGLANTYLVTASLFKLIFTRTAGVLPFQLLLTTEFDPYALVRQTLGFPPGVIEADTAGVINAPFRTVLQSVQYVDVVAQELSKNFYGNPALARIPVLGGLNGVTEYDPQTISTRTFWPIQRMVGLTLQFFAGPTCPAYSLLYNFNGLNNSLTLKITCQEYKNIFMDDFCIEQMV